MDNYFLIEKKLKERKRLNKTLLFVVLAIVVITLSSIAGIMYAKSRNEEFIAKHFAKTEETPQDENIVEETLEAKESKEEMIPLPVYSEDAKNRMNNIYVADTEEKHAYLTFDDGPSANVTPQILKILEDEGIKATFFVLGSRVKLYPELIKQEYEAGHYIANHRIFTSICKYIFFCKCSVR